MKKLGFTYMFCNDLKAMKKFYQDLLQLDVIWDTKESIAFQIGEHQLSIEYHKDFHPPLRSFPFNRDGRAVPNLGQDGPSVLIKKRLLKPFND